MTRKGRNKDSISPYTTTVSAVDNSPTSNPTLSNMPSVNESLLSPPITPISPQPVLPYSCIQQSVNPILDGNNSLSMSDSDLASLQALYEGSISEATLTFNSISADLPDSAVNPTPMDFTPASIKRQRDSSLGDQSSNSFSQQGKKASSTSVELSSVPAPASNASLQASPSVPPEAPPNSVASKDNISLNKAPPGDRSHPSTRSSCPPGSTVASSPGKTSKTSSQSQHLSPPTATANKSTPPPPESPLPSP